MNLYIAGANGKKLDITYRMAWLRGLKTTYYLRAMAPRTTEKSTIGRRQAERCFSNEWPPPVPQKHLNERPGRRRTPACSIDDPDCEARQ